MLYSQKLGFGLCFVVGLFFIYHLMVMSEKMSVPIYANCDSIRRRALDLQQNCKRMKLHSFRDTREVVDFEATNDSRPWLFLSLKYNTVYCQIPKSGSTNWLRVLAVLNGHLANISDKADKDIHTMPMPNDVVPSLSKNESERILKTGIKFMVVRNPLERLLSAYKDKLENPNSGFREIAKQIVEFNGGENNRKTPTFNEFLTYVNLEKEFGIPAHVAINRHWKDFYSLCFPCDIKYDYILTVENLEEDSNCLLRAIGAPENLTFPPSGQIIQKNHRRIETGKNKNDYYKLVEEYVLQHVVELYKRDFLLFDFDSSLYHQHVNHFL